MFTLENGPKRYYINLELEWKMGTGKCIFKCVREKNKMSIKLGYSMGIPWERGNWPGGQVPPPSSRVGKVFVPFRVSVRSLEGANCKHFRARRRLRISERGEKLSDFS